MDDERRSDLKAMLTAGRVALLVGVICIGAVILLWRHAVPLVPTVLEGGKTTECSINLGHIYTDLVEYKLAKGHLPRESGVRFFAAPIAEGVVPYDREGAERLTCPSIDLDLLTIGSLPWDEWWRDLSVIDGTYSSYAGRDTVRFPLEKLSGTQPLVACDGDGYTHHGGVIHVLYGNGAVRAMTLDDLIRSGEVPSNVTSIEIGPGSPHEDLRKLTRD